MNSITVNPKLNTIYPAVILDTETTGLKEPQPLEVAHISLRELHHYETVPLLAEETPIFQSRFDVTKEIDYAAEKIHGISKSQVKGLPVYSGLHQLELPDEASYIICHNASFDSRVIEPGTDFFRYKYICTVKLARQLWPGRRSYALTKLMEEFFPDNHKKLTANAHGALIDCKLVLLLLEKAMEEYELESWEDLYELAGYRND